VFFLQSGDQEINHPFTDLVIASADMIDDPLGAAEDPVRPGGEQAYEM